MWNISLFSRLGFALPLWNLWASQKLECAKLLYYYWFHNPNYCTILDFIIQITILLLTSFYYYWLFNLVINGDAEFKPVVEGQSVKNWFIPYYDTCLTIRLNFFTPEKIFSHMMMYVSTNQILRCHSDLIWNLVKARQPNLKHGFNWGF